MLAPLSSRAERSPSVSPPSGPTTSTIGRTRVPIPHGVGWSERSQVSKGKPASGSSTAIVAAGRARHQVTSVMGGFESRKVIPLSVTFDHRACTGGEAARFLKALIDDLALVS